LIRSALQYLKSDKAKFLLVAAAGWLLIAALTTLNGNAMPILFQFQQYFLSSALFGLGLGFFHQPRQAPAGEIGADANHQNQAGQSQNTTEGSQESTSGDLAGAAKSAENYAEKTAENNIETQSPDNSESSSATAAKNSDTAGSDAQKGSMGSGWAAWLAVIMLVLLWVVNTNYPGGLANAMAVTLQDESVDVFMAEFDSGRMAADIVSVGLFGTMLFVWIQIFVGPGKQLKRLCEDFSPALALSLFAGAGALAWTVYAGLALLGLPPLFMLSIACAALVALSKNRPVTGLCAAAAVVLCFFMTTSTLKAEIASAGQYKNLESCSWANGSRIDTRPIVNGNKLIALSVWLDRSLYQLLPAVIPDENDSKSLQKQCGLPAFPNNYHDLLYRAMPDMKGKNALVLGAGVGTEVGACLFQGLAQVTAVEAQKWLTDLSSKQPFSPYRSKSVAVVTADPRQYLRRTRSDYDLIIYSGHSAVNRPNPFIAIDHDDFIYTVEGLYDALKHLKEDGQLVIATPPGNDLVRTRMAANMLALNALIDAELTTPYANYIIFSRTPLKTGPAAEVVPSLRSKVGSKIVNHETLLASRANRTMLTRDDRPFIPGWAPMIPLADSFLSIITMLAMFCSMRIHVGKSILQNVSRARCCAFLLATVFAILSSRAYMITLMEFGSTPQVIYGSIVFASLILGGAAALAARSGGSKTSWVLRAAFGLVLLIDLFFNYEEAFWLVNPLIRLAACAILPLAPAALAAGLLGSAIRPAKAEALGLSLAGFSLGYLLALWAMFNGLASLDLMALGLSLTVLLLTFWPEKAKIPLN
jgi:hypothetical protein